MSSQHWANIGDDDGALHALLRRLREHVPLALIDYLWIFPPRRVAAGDSIVLVVAAYDDDPIKRRVITALFTITRNRKGQAFVNARFDEHGSAPSNAVSRIVDGVLHRLGEDADTTLRELQIGGDTELWNALISELGGTPHTPADSTDAQLADPARIEPHAAPAAPPHFAETPPPAPPETDSA